MGKQTEFEHPPKGHVGLLAYDIVTDKWYAVLGDDDGHILLEAVTVALPDGAATSLKQLANDHDVNVSNMITGFATETKQLADGHNVTIDNPLLAVDGLSFESIVEERIANTTLATGDNTLAGTEVGAGKIWKITHVVARYVGTEPSLMAVYVNDLALGTRLMSSADLDATGDLFWSGEIYMQVGDSINLWIEGATLNDDAYLHYVGVQMSAP